MQKQNNNTIEKEFTLKNKIFTYFQGFVKAVVINCFVAGVLLAVSHFAFHSKYSTAAYSNAMFMIAVLYMIYCFTIFQGDLNSRVDSSNLELTSTRFGRSGSSQMIRDKFSRGESIMIIGSYTLATLGIAYLMAII